MPESSHQARNPNREATHRYVQGPNESTSTVVTRAVTDVLDRDIESLQPLGAVLDVDALDSLTEPNGRSVHVEFEYEDCVIAVEGGAEVLVAPKT